MALLRGGPRDRQYRAVLAPQEIQGASPLRTLGGGDRVYAGPGQVPSYDWTQQGVPGALLAVRRRAAQLAASSYEDCQPASLLGTLLAQDAMAPGDTDLETALGGVVTQRTRGSRWAQYRAGTVSEDAQQQSALLLAPLGSVPGASLWPDPARLVPRAARHSQADQLALCATVLAGADALYGAPGEAPPYDWPVPKGRPRPIATRLLELGLVLGTLAGQDALYGPPGQVPAVDAPNPRIRPYPTLLRDHGLALVNGLLVAQDAVYGAAGQAPAYELPTPRGPARRPQPEPPAALVLGVLAAQDQVLYYAPGEVATYDWPNPRRPARPRTPIDAALGLVLATLAGQDALYGAAGQAPPYEWPVPKGARRPLQPEVLASLLGTTLLVVAVPLAPIDYPNPRLPARPRVPVDLALGLVLGTLAGVDAVYAAPGEAPAYDYPNPRGRPFPPSNRGLELSLVANSLRGQDALYGDQGEAPSYDYPNPRPRPPHRSNRSHELSLTLATLAGADAVYGAPGQAPVYEWVVPKGYRRGRADLIVPGDHGPDTLLRAPGEALAYDWPVPKGRRRPANLYDPPNELAPLTAAPPLVPGKIVFSQGRPLVVVAAAARVALVAQGVATVLYAPPQGIVVLAPARGLNLTGGPL